MGGERRGRGAYEKNLYHWVGKSANVIEKARVGGIYSEGLGKVMGGLYIEWGTRVKF